MGAPVGTDSSHCGEISPGRGEKQESERAAALQSGLMHCGAAWVPLRSDFVLSISGV